jgi:hypothetical protein
VAIASDAEHPAILDEGAAFFVADELRRKSYSALVAGDRITHDGLGSRKEEAEAVAAATEEPRLFAVALRRQREARDRDAVGWVLRGNEAGSAAVEEEVAKEGGFL